MRFLLINPARTVKKTNIWSVIKSSTPPIGIATLAALLEKNEFHVDIIDAQAMLLTPEETVAQTKATDRYDIIGFTATTPEINSATKTAYLFRSAFPKARILFGGVHPTLFHHQLVESWVADFVIRGEGEEPIIALAQSDNLHEVPSLTWRDKTGKVIVNELTKTLVNLDNLPLPAYHKLPMKQYYSALGAAKKSPSIGIITSRGCPGSCTFCYSAMFGKVIRYLSAERVLEHIILLKNDYGINEISFYDDTFTADRNRVIKICNLLIQERLNLSWSCFARIDTVDQELLNTMHQAGCHQIMYGFESSNDNVLKTINKCVTTQNYHEVVRMSHAAGIDVRGAFMLGNIGETEQSLKNTISYAVQLQIQYAIFNITTPYPGTALYNWAEKNNCLIHHNWEVYDYAHPVMKLPTISPNTIQKQYKNAYQTFYLRPTYIVNLLPKMIRSGLLKSSWNVFWGIILMMVQKQRTVKTP